MGKIWEQFRATPFGELVTGQAFESYPADGSVPLAERFKQEPLLVLAIGTRQMKLAVLRFDEAGQPVISNVQTVGSKGNAALSDHLRMAVRTNKEAGNWAVVLVSHNWQAEIVPHAFHGTMRERMLRLRESTEIVCGRAIGSDQKVVVVPHPAMEVSFLFQQKLSSIREIIEAVKAAGLRIARVQLPHASMFEAFTVLDPQGAQARDMVVIDQQGGFMIFTDNKEWIRSRFRNNQPGELIQDFRKFWGERKDRNAPITIVGDPSILTPLWREIEKPELIVPFQHEHPEIYAAALF